MKKTLKDCDLDRICGGAAVKTCSVNNPTGAQPTQYVRSGQGKKPINVPNPAHTHYRPGAQQLHNVATHRSNNFKRMLGSD